MYAQERVSSVCGTPEMLIPQEREWVTDISQAKTNIVHPCGTSGTINLRVVVHFMLKSDGTGNFNEFNDGRVNDPRPSGAPTDYHYQWNGYRFAAELIHAANTIMAVNDTLELTPASICPIYTPRPAVYPKRILYTLQGVYFHRNTNATQNDYYTGYTDTYADTYGIKKDSCIQIFLFPTNSSYLPSGYVHNIPGNNNNMACFLKNYWNGYNAGSITWENVLWSSGIAAHKVLNHEIMHLLGLWHTNSLDDLFYKDFCEDTPNCNEKSGYNTIVNDGLCEICQTILTPDQLERAYTILSGGLLWNSGPPYAKNYLNMSYATKYIHQCNTCAPIGSPAYSFFHINKTSCGEVFIGGGWYGTWYNTGSAHQFIEIFETNAIGSNTVTGAYYSGWRAVDEYSFLRNLSSVYGFQHGKIYKIKMAVTTSCTGWHESSQWIAYSNPNPCERIAQIPVQNNAQVYPNPVTDKANITFTHPVQHIQVTDAIGRIIDTFVAENPYFSTWQPKTDLPNGLYFIISDNKQNSVVKIMVQR